MCVFVWCACVCARVYLKNSRGARGVKLFEAFSKAEPNQLLVNLAWLGFNGASSLCEWDADRHCQSRKRNSERECERGTATISTNCQSKAQDKKKFILMTKWKLWQLQAQTHTHTHTLTQSHTHPLSFTWPGKMQLSALIKLNSCLEHRRAIETKLKVPYCKTTATTTAAETATAQQQRRSNGKERNRNW